LGLGGPQVSLPFIDAVHARRMCSDCAAEMLERMASAPVLCPFCRGVVRGFKGYAGSGGGIF
jgi:hypothetical protein